VLRMQNDGNLVLYKGTASLTTGAIWSSKTHEQGDCFVTMQDDGNLVIYRGSSPGEAREAIWSSGRTDRIASISVTGIAYDLESSNVRLVGIPDLMEISGQNNTQIDLVIEKEFSVEVTESSTFSSTVGVEFSVSTSFECSIPLVSKSEVELTASSSYEATFGRTTERSETVTSSASLTVPPDHTYTLSLVAEKSEVSLPYTATGEIKLESGAVLTRIRGNYRGSNYDKVRVIASME